MTGLCDRSASACVAATHPAAAAAAAAAAHPPALPSLCRPPSLEGASLRAEAEAPFRGFRLFIFGAGAVGAGLATLFGLPQLIGALGGAPNATKSAAEALQDFAINVGSFSALAFLVQRDLKVGGVCAVVGWSQGCPVLNVGCDSNCCALPGGTGAAC